MFTIMHIVLKPYLAWRITKWDVKLSKLDISYEPRKELNAYILDELIVEITIQKPNTPPKWTMFVEGSSYAKDRGAELLLVEINTISSPWSFTWWGINILGHFPITPGQLNVNHCH